MSFSLTNCRSVLILGGGGIGMALAREVRINYPNLQVFVTNREGPLSQEVTILRHDPLNEESWKSLVEKLKQKTDKLDLIISTYGLLHDEVTQPEKKLSDIHLNQMEKVFRINAFTAPLAARYLQPFLSKKDPSIFCFLSAKVGSISDNGLGGWYSYRASKAALNMFGKTISIEFSRLRIPTKVLLIHPGTTKTKLSAPFIKNTSYQLWEPEEAAHNILKVIVSPYKEEEKCVFVSWNGEHLPW